MRGHGGRHRVWRASEGLAGGVQYSRAGPLGAGRGGLQMGRDLSDPAQRRASSSRCSSSRPGGPAELGTPRAEAPDAVLPPPVPRVARAGDPTRRPRVPGASEGPKALEVSRTLGSFPSRAVPRTHLESLGGCWTRVRVSGLQHLPFV